MMKKKRSEHSRAGLILLASVRTYKPLLHPQTQCLSILVSCIHVFNVTFFFYSKEIQANKKGTIFKSLTY